MKKEKVLVLMLLVCFLLSFVSCASPKANKDELQVISVEPETSEPEPAEELAEEEDESNWLSALGDIKGLDIKSYRLRGEGPDGASFDWVEVTNTKVALSDIRRGQWTLYAQAIGENGEILATGTLETFLSNSSPLGTLVMDSEVGEGDVRCAFAWNTFQVLYPSIEIYVKKGDGEYIPRDSSEISIGDGVATWRAEDLGAGSYVVRAILKDEGEIVAGVAAAMRIIDGKQSVGDVRFTVGKLSTIYGISFENTPTVTVRGNLELKENGDVTYVSDFTDLKYDWFLNGEYINRENSETLNVFQVSSERGFFRFDCIVQNNNSTSINSSSILVYSDGNTARVVTVEEAESMKGDTPANYEEIQTNSEASVEREEAIEELSVALEETPVEEAVEEVVAPVVEEVIEEPVEEEPIYYVTGGTN
jgi:hypothetical protein